jgi:ATP-dependent DNA helicase 2 subunit 2
MGQDYGRGVRGSGKFSVHPGSNRYSRLSSKPKIERFWRKFCLHLSDVTPPDQPHLLPSVGSLLDALSAARGPVLDGPKSMLSKSIFRIGEMADSPEQAIEVPVRYSKATALARPQSLKKVIASQVARLKTLPESITAGASQAPRASQSQSQLYGAGTSTAAVTSGIAGIEADVSAYTKYFVVQKKEEQEDIEMEDGEGERRIQDDDADVEDEAQYEEMEVDIANCTKAYRFGSTWVPLNEEDFDTMPTTSGFEVLGFIKQTGVSADRMVE